jgi:hypothetical protein
VGPAQLGTVFGTTKPPLVATHNLARQSTRINHCITRRLINVRINLLKDTCLPYIQYKASDQDKPFQFLTSSLAHRSYLPYHKPTFKTENRDKMFWRQTFEGNVT